MPALRPLLDAPAITLPPRTATYGGRADVLVVGGGPAGMGAALGAAWAGAKVVLVERFGFLGGNPTAALVMPLMSFHTQRGAPNDADSTRLFPTDHGPGEPIVAGALAVFLERLIAAGGAVSPSSETGYTVPADPEIYKLVALELLDETGVELLFHAFVSGIVGKSGRPEGLVFETKSGPVVIEAGAIVDGTGDGDAAVRAGARFDIGRDGDNRVQPMTLMFRMAGFDQKAFSAYVHENPSQWRGVHGLWDLVTEATLAGELDLQREDILFFATPHEGELSVNSTRMTGVSGTSVWDLTEAEIEGRRQMGQIAAFLRRHVPGFKTAYIVQSGVSVGVRETRRIIGDYRLTAEDVLEARKFDDAIARGSYPVDIHSPTGKGTVLKRLPPGDYYEIPLRCLLPWGVDRLIVAGRCISGTHEAHSSYRVTPTAMATGQAAGVCGALAAKRGRLPREIPAAEVQRVLREQGASLRPTAA
ncbi:FAD-dependent oxidoreductase [Rhodospirillaceae bacterium SYSU D60014]|uniref:FAD-dependent oxidoreductase n=1 Tax=Virgifigura deserti TaxID=2268457 RepID=UPI000E6722B5